MNDTYETDISYENMSNIEQQIVKYLSQVNNIEFLTDPQKKQYSYEMLKKQAIFSFRSLDSAETDSSDLTPLALGGRTYSLVLTKSPLKNKRLSIISEKPLI